VTVDTGRNKKDHANGDPGENGKRPQEIHRRFVYTLSIAVFAVSAATTGVWLLLDYSETALPLLLALTAASGTSGILAHRGSARWAARLLFGFSLGAIMGAHLLTGEHVISAALLSGGYLNCILLAGALFSSRGALMTTLLLAVYSSAVSFLHYREGTEEALSLIPIFLSEFAVAAGIMYYLSSAQSRLRRYLSSTALRAHRNYAELKESEKRFRRFIEMSPVAVFFLDNKGIYTFVNPAAEQLTGYSREELVGSRFPVFTPSEYRDRHMREFSRLLKEKKSVLETVISSKDGRSIDVLSHAVKLDEEHYMIYATDISERTRYEHELKEAYRLAEEANKAKSEFLHTMSHEVRTPLNTIIGMTNILEQRSSASVPASYLESIELSAYSLLGIFEEILDFARIESGDIEAGYADFELFTLAEEALKPIILKAKEKELVIRCDFDPELPTRVLGDYLHMKQILTHLLHNAVKFTEEGGITFSMSATAWRDRHTTVEFTVRDTGIGIEPEQQAEIFELFRQADNSSTKHYGGIGLGLTLCKNLTALLQGDLSFSSASGAGSTFTFSVELETPEPSDHPELPDLRMEIVICAAERESREQLISLLKHYGQSPYTFDADQDCMHMLSASTGSPRCDVCIVELHQLFEGDEDTSLGAYLREHRNEIRHLIALVPLFWEGVYSQVKEIYGIHDYLVQPITPPKLLSVLSSAAHG
jgi:PAS domain S-box-containing protein